MQLTAPIRGSLKRNRPRELVIRAAGTLKPHNAAVIARNVAAVARSRVSSSTPPWNAYLPRTKDSLTQARARGIAWLCNSQDAVGSGGVGSFGFAGWTRGYPEVTGYIIPTIWDAACDLGDEKLAARAIRMADWELSIQTPSGGWEGGVVGDGLPPIVFNSGQVVRGLIRTYDETGDEKYLAAAVRGADWIVSVQEADGSWSRTNHLGLKRVYDTYVAAPLAAVAAITSDGRYADAAAASCEFALRQQRDNGWFDLCDNSPHHNDAPSTHTLCYTIDGLIESGTRLDRTEFVDAAAKAARRLADQVASHGFLAGRFSASWQPRVRWSCLTGVAQLGIVIGRLDSATVHPDRDELVGVMWRLADFLSWTVELNGIGADRRGAVAGSFPIWGTYAPLRYPCWATKYMVDFLRVLAARVDVSESDADGVKAPFHAR